MAIAIGCRFKLLPKPRDHAQGESAVASNGLLAAYRRCGTLKLSGLEQIQGSRFIHWTPEEMAMALLLQGGQIPFRSQQEIQARLQSRDAVDEQEQMHARDGQSEIERRAGVTGKGFVQHGAKLVFGEAADPIEGHRASSLTNDLCGRDSRLCRRRVKRPCCVRYDRTTAVSPRPRP